jgi:2,3,4,5-tetrahydropyridine-2,6-dicarboxylate N-succinyltransferase
MNHTPKISQVITSNYAHVAEIDAENAPKELLSAIKEALMGLNDGQWRVAEPTAQGWQVNMWLKQAILLYFKTQKNQKINAGHQCFYDKIPLKYQIDTNFDEHNVRVVPGASARFGSYIAQRSILMPCYINIGAYIDQGTMIDTWATIGSAAQIGKNVHISGGVGIGGVLEPLQANPTIIEDNCFIGARSEIVEGVIVRRNSVISMGVFIGQSTPIYNRETEVISYGEVPEGSVVIPGSLPSKDGKYNRNCALIVKQVDERTRQKVSINQLLRDSCPSE